MSKRGRARRDPAHRIASRIARALGIEYDRLVGEVERGLFWIRMGAEPPESTGSDLTSFGPVERLVLVGQGHAVLFMADGEIRFAHDCDRTPANPNRHPRFRNNAGTHRIAPRLQIGQGHEIVTVDPLTIVASILCADCGLHGFVTNGAWV